MKKLLIILLGMIFIGSSFATYQTSNTWRSPEYKSMNFQANLENNSVAMTWAPFTLPAGHSFVYWKVMRSQQTNNPVYKEANSEYVKYDSNINFTWYTDNRPKAGNNRYRICAITKASDGYHRYCSNTVKEINIADYTENKETYQEKQTTTSSSSLTESQKSVLDQLAIEFTKKLEEKFGTDKTKKKLVLESVISQLNNIGKKQARMKATIDYLVSKLELIIDPFDEIKEILDID